jgi:YidC/Oxa1 family membrane protein insertase
MDKQNLRFFLLVMIMLLGFSLFNKYSVKDVKIQQNLTDNNQHNFADNSENSDNKDVPETSPTMLSNKASNNDLLPSSPKQFSGGLFKKDSTIVTVSTDLLKVKINSNGDLVFAELKNYPQNNNKHKKGFALLSESKDRFYIAQSGLLSDLGPDSQLHGRDSFSSPKEYYDMSTSDHKLQVDLFCHKTHPEKIDFIKRFTFYKNSYVIKIEYIITNHSEADYVGSMYGRLRRNQSTTDAGSRNFFGGGVKTYMGAAISTADNKYKKISFPNLKNFYKTSFNGGWIAMLEHYFVSAWIPDRNNLSEYQTEQYKDNSLGIRFINEPVVVQPGETKSIAAKLYLGPKIAKILKSVSPELDLTVDYGILWWLCVPLFALLQFVFNIIGNWGWSIIVTTLLIKTLFYKLSATSYRSMGNLRKLQPKIEALKANYGSDKQKFSQAIMDLYRKEKVNPLGGCLPILIQIPVFIALYYVLLESVELRQAPWCLWIKDLSIKDPLYILPIIMGISMFLQQKMNPPPADPIQAKVLMIMPLFFTLLFLQFPSGLMLYWIVNNFLSILQQQFITKSIEQKQVSRAW